MHMSKMETMIPKGVQVDQENQPDAPLRHKVAAHLLSIPEPAIQSAAIQLIRNDLTLDRSLFFCLGLVAMAVLEELI